MILPSPLRFPYGLLALLLVAVLTAGGCRKAEIRTYTAPKDEPPEIVWQRPSVWTDDGSDKMSTAKFSAPGGVSVLIMPLGQMEGRDSALVNMWRQATGQEPLDEAAAEKTLSPVEVAGGKGRLFEVTGKREEEMKVVSAFIHRDKSWFFNLKGPPAAVDAQKPVFLEFLKTVEFTSPAPVKASPVAPPPAGDDAVAVPGTAPESWTAVPPGAMQAAKFAVAGKDGQKAEVTVSVFPSDTGGIVSNANRWRGQIGLPPVDEAALKDAVKTVPGAPEGSMMMEFENAGKTLTSLIVPRGGKWFFYKLTGDTAAVAAARDGFISYCKAGS